MRWMWLSFADPMRPKGSQFLGVAIVDVPSDLPGDLWFIEAVDKAHALGINPGGEVQGIEIPEDLLPPRRYRNRLLTSEEDLEAIEAVQLEQG